MRVFSSGVALALSMASLLSAQGIRPPRLPVHSFQWINSCPYNVDQKAVVLWFFEEGCPRCRAKWPELIRLSEKYAEQPVVFIAISSGTNRREMESYIRDVGVTWPTLLDSNREFEKNAGVQQINLQNIHQVSVIDGRGRYSRGDWGNVESCVTTALTGAAWQYFEAEQVPVEAQAAWRHVEFGQYTQAASLLTQLQLSQDVRVVTAAEKLWEITRGALERDIATLPSSADVWIRYQAMRAIADKYQGIELPEDFRREGSRLHTLPEIGTRLQK